MAVVDEVPKDKRFFPDKLSIISCGHGKELFFLGSAMSSAWVIILSLSSMLLWDELLIKHMLERLSGA